MTMLYHESDLDLAEWDDAEALASALQGNYQVIYNFSEEKFQLLYKEG